MVLVASPDPAPQLLSLLRELAAAQRETRAVRRQLEQARQLLAGCQAEQAPLREAAQERDRLADALIRVRTELAVSRQDLYNALTLVAGVRGELEALRQAAREARQHAAPPTPEEVAVS